MRCRPALCQLDLANIFLRQRAQTLVPLGSKARSPREAKPNFHEASKGSMKLNSYLLKSTLVASLGGLLFGFDTAVIAGTTHALTTTFHLSPAALGMTVSAALWGTILGSMLAGIPGDRFGRRDSLRVMAVLYLVSALGCAMAWSWSALVLFPFNGGLGIGGSSVRGPMYIAEVA